MEIMHDAHRAPAYRPPAALTGLLGLAVLVGAGASARAADPTAGRLAWPLDAPPAARRLSSSFAENRGSHLHGGVDISTGGEVGVPVVAVADGEVFRVKVRWRGLGRAIYLRHPDGLVTVYGHLAGFAPPVRAWVEGELEARGPYPGDLWPDRAFRFRRGEVIAWSGKTGGGPPHLHFETRRENGTRPVDPFGEGLPCPDTEPPRVVRVLGLPDAPGGETFHWSAATGVEDPGTVSPGMRLVAQVQDPLGAGTGGMRSLRARVGDRVLLDLDADAFSYAHARLAPFVFVPGLGRSTPAEVWYWLHDLPGNELPFVSGMPHVAAEQDASGGPTVLHVVARDGCGNETRARIPLTVAAPRHGGPSAWDLPFPDGEGLRRAATLRADRGGSVRVADARLDVPAGALGEDAVVRVAIPQDAGLLRSGLPPGLRVVSGPAHLGSPLTPLRRKAVVHFRADGIAVDDPAVAVFHRDAARGTWLHWGADHRRDGWIGCSTDRLGVFALVRDESGPVLEEVERRAVRGRPWRPDGEELLVRYAEAGLGVGWDGGALELPGVADRILGHVDPDESTVTFPLPASVAGQALTALVRLTDGAGLTAERRLVLPAEEPR